MWDSQILSLLSGYGADIGCGMDACPKATHLIDIHPEVARKYQHTHTVHLFDINDGLEMWKDNLFDFTVSKDALQYFSDPKFVIDEMIRITKPGGKILLSSDFNNQIFLAASTLGLEINITKDTRDQEFLLITNDLKQKKYLTQTLPQISKSATGKIREFHRKSIWPIYINPPQNKTYKKLSLVIATYGQSHLTVECIKSLLAYAPKTEIIVVDNASPDDTLEKLKQFEDKITVIKQSENLGCAGAWNVGLKAATGDLLGVLNNDTTVFPDGVQQISDEAWRIGIACWHAGVVYPDLKFLGHSAIGHGTDFPNGCALLFRRDVFEDVGFFDDEMKPGYNEDSDWGFRARMKGYSWGVCSKILFHHHESTAKHVPGIQEARERNYKRLVQKWQNKGAGERILVRRWAAIGDVLMATPLLAALRKQKPLAHIHFQCFGPIATLLDGIDSVDVVSENADSNYTTVYDLDGAYEELLKTNEWVHPVTAYSRILQIEPLNIHYEAAPTQDLDDWVKSTLRAQRRPCIALVPRSAGRPSANWSESNWVKLVQEFPEYNFVVLDGAPQPALEVHDMHTGKRLYEQPNVIDLTGKTPTLRHAMAIIRHCVAGIGVDTGVTHMINAAKIPMVLIVGTAAGWARAPLAGNCRVLQGASPCYPCKVIGACPRKDIPHCLTVVTPEMAANNLRELL